MIKLKVTGMTCEHCEKAVHKALIAVPGVADVITVDRTTEEPVKGVPVSLQPVAETEPVGDSEGGEPAADPAVAWAWATRSTPVR